MLGALIHSCTVRYTLEGEADASVASPAHVQRFFFLPSAQSCVQFQPCPTPDCVRDCHVPGPVPVPDGITTLDLESAGAGELSSACPRFCRC